MTVTAVAASLLSVSVPALAATGHGAGLRVRHAATGQAELTGQVRDGRPLQGKSAAKTVVPDGLATVAGAVVSLPALHRATTTNATGSFAFRGLSVPAGSTLTLVVRKTGFGSWREGGISLIPGEPAQVYVQLSTAPQKLTVTRTKQPDNGPRTGAAPKVPGGCGHNSSGWTSQTKEPPTIRVYLTGPGTVITYDYSFYEKHVLPNEWIASWLPASLEAGAVAVRDYAWFFVVNGSKGTASGYNPCAFDVDDTTAYQRFIPGAPTYTSTDSAVDTTADYLFTHNSKIPETSFNAGPATCGGGEPADTMSQNGSQVCAQGGDSFGKILGIYYQGFTLTHPGGGGGGPTGLPGGPAVFNPGGDDLEVYGVGADHSLQEAYYKNGAWHSNT
ncbi:MAG TPA: carboxypeptidase regulatory-like domain-containing protein, partial [Streptosporangiaceae bacterium]|nr:carboxypeptidase regulatory-like domain-containing protein [Streptosporangiaceae bacterium]